MGDPKDQSQTLKTPPAMPSSRRVSAASAASQGRRRSSASSRRASSLSFGNLDGLDDEWFQQLVTADPQDNGNFTIDDNAPYNANGALPSDQQENIELGAYGNGQQLPYDSFLNNEFGEFTNSGFEGFNLDDFGLKDTVRKASLDMYNQPRFAIPSTQPEATKTSPPPQTQQLPAFYNPQAAANFQAQPWLEPVQGYQPVPADFIDPELLGLGPDPVRSSAKSFLHADLGLDDEHVVQPMAVQPRKRGYSESSPEPPKKKLRSSGSNNSSYSRYSSSTDDEVARSLRKSRQLAQRPSTVQVYIPGEKPKAQDDRPWVRVNATTKGLTTRTAKINKYAAGTPGYTEVPHPLGDWISHLGNEFKYTAQNEFSEKTYSASQMRDFIFHYPHKHGLKIWIQKCPTDSARRYVSQTHAKCRFRECPAQLYQTGTILHGHYRVAFDEMTPAYGQDKDTVHLDPFHVAGYAHLYCMERFLDFEAVCKLGIVAVDDRPLPREPRGKFAATLAAQVEFDIANDFVKFASTKHLRDLPDFANYPVHTNFKRGAAKPHELTLTYRMTETKERSRPQAQVRQFKDRGLKPSHLYVNRGDLEVLFQDVIRRKKASRKSKGKKRAAAPCDDEVDLDHVLEERVARANEKAEAAMGGRKRSPQSSRWQRASPRHREAYDSESEESDHGGEGPVSDDEPDDGPQQTPTHTDQPTRRSPRNRGNTQPNYAVDEQLDALVQQADPAAAAPMEPGDYDFGLPPMPLFYSEEDYQELRRRLSSVSNVVRPRSRGLSILKSPMPRTDYKRRASVGFSDKISTREFDAEDAPEKVANRRQNPSRSAASKQKPASNKAQDSNVAKPAQRSKPQRRSTKENKDEQGGGGKSS